MISEKGDSNYSSLINYTFQSYGEEQAIANAKVLELEFNLQNADNLSLAERYAS